MTLLFLPLFGGCVLKGWENAGPRHVLLISLDTVRADHLGCYDAERLTSPSLDAFVEEGVLFEKAISAAPWTLPSHASVMTGLYPGRHGVRTRHDQLSDEVPTLASVLRQQGFATGAVVNGLFLAEPFGLDQGFDHYELVYERPSAGGSARRVTDAALRWLEAQRDRRVLLFVHYFDVHSDYVSLPRYEQMFGARRDRVDGTTEQLLEVNRGQRSLDADDLVQLVRLYDAGIRQLDDEFGRLLARLSDGGWLDESLVVVFSDHGEQFLEHGALLHGQNHHPELLRVPLILRGPALPRALRVREPVSLVDVVPTILGALGLPVPEGLDGRDLAPLWETPGRDPGPRWIFAETGPGNRVDTRRSVQDGRYKLIVDLESGHRELYDLRADPGETRDVLDHNPDVARRLAEQIERLTADRREASPAPALSAETREQLWQLGYGE